MIILDDTQRQYLRPDEVAELFDVSRRTVYHWVHLGKIPSVRVGGSIRFPVAALRDWAVRVDVVQSSPSPTHLR